MEARRTLNEFGEMMRPAGPKHVSYSLVESYVSKIRERGNAPATIVKKLTYLRCALTPLIGTRFGIQGIAIPQSNPSAGAMTNLYRGEVR